MSGNDDILLLRHVEISREIVFDFGQRYLFHSGSPAFFNHSTDLDFSTIANISTVVLVTS